MSDNATLTRSAGKRTSIAVAAFTGLVSVVGAGAIIAATVLMMIMAFLYAIVALLTGGGI